MSATILDAQTVRTMFLAAAANLERNKAWINDLNVFPVPDGDTGTNMTLTVMSAVKEINALEDISFDALAKAISSGSLRGARGNSGVITSQLFRGLCKEMTEHTELDKQAIAAAMKRATETAYKAVMKPREGTILTVARGMSEKAEELASDPDLSIENFIRAIIEHGDITLEHTPELLPVLKQAGVVDSGGQGLMQLVKGAYQALIGEFDENAMSEHEGSGAALDFAETSDMDEITFGYCTEFLVNVEKHYDEMEEYSFKQYLESIGDCVVVVSDDDIIKVHVHTNDPGLAIQKGLSYGSLSRMKIDNMREEHEEKLIREASRIAKEEKAKEAAEANVPRKPYGFVAVSPGKGLADIFRDLGADGIIEGGQTMNPSAEDVVKAVEKVNADTVYVLPNNSNIILAAEQATYLVKDKTIKVVPTKTVPQGITAMISFDENAGADENLETMTDALSTVHTGQVTYAIRDTSIDGKEIHENDIMGLGDHSALLAVGNDIEDVAKQVIASLVDDDCSVISIYYGEMITEDEAERLGCQIEAAYPDMDVEINCGGQPVYYYIISAE